MEEKKRNKIIIFSIVVAFLLLVFYLIGASSTDKGNYDYCIEWERLDDEGLKIGVFHRNNLIYTCYNLALLEFKCDYEIQEDGSLMVKPIVNTTKGEDGLLTSITYGEANYFDCIRWLKSRG